MRYNNYEVCFLTYKKFMNRCQNCGQGNSESSNFCRFCGSKIILMQNQDRESYEENPPRPYSWQTDEFKIKENPGRQTQQIDRIQPLINQPQHINQPIVSHQQYQNQQMQPQYQNQLSTGYRCPFCHTNALPLVVKKVSPAGWAVFTVLLVTTFILFWIGLLIQEERRICPACNMRVG